MIFMVGYIILAVIAVLIIFTAIRAIFFVPKKKDVISLEKEAVNAKRVQDNLSKAIQCKTVSHDDPEKTDWNEFKKFHEFLENAYPLIHKNTTKEVISRASLIYKWEGTNPDLEPMAMLSHQDVVPVTQGTEGDWEHEAFSGYNDGEYIWGRGAIDMKNHLICVMEAVETLMEEGFKPERDVYLCFGHNEEVVCANDPGAQKIVETLKNRGIHLDSVIDEGGAILTADIKGLIDTYVICIGTAEKGYCDYKITVHDKGGHTSQAPDHNGLGKLADVIKDLENNQCKAKLLPFIDNLLDRVGRTTTYLGRFLFCNYKLLKPLLRVVMTKIPVAACLVRTVTAVSMCEGSPAPNVLPQRASVTANFRTIYGESVADVGEHIHKVVKNKDIEVECLREKEASRFSPTDSRAFNAIEDISSYMLNDKNVAVVPYLVMGGTDAYFYEEISENVLRYAPFKLSVGVLKTTHATNERCPVSVLEDGVAFFKTYVRKVSKAD